MTILRPSPMSPGGNYSDPPLTLPHDDSLLSGLSGSTLNEGQASMNATHYHYSSELMHETTQSTNIDMIGSSNMRGVTPKQDTTITPRVGNTRRSTSYDQQNHAAGSMTVSNSNYLSTPSWDIDNTFSFCKKNMKSKETRHQSQRSQSSIPMWDILSAIGQSKSESTVIDETSKMNRDEPHERLREEEENGLYAMQVGLMYSADDGDTIVNSQCLQNLPASFTMESDMSAADLTKYLKYRRQSGVAKNNDDDDDVIKGDDSISTVSVNTFRDEHGNMIPTNAKMILGYDDAKRRKESWSKRNQIDKEFPTVQTNVPPKEMEKRLRDIAGQISADWRGTSFMPPTLARRLRDFQFAREKRRKKYGMFRPWGILGLYYHLSGVKLDIEWAEDAAWRRSNKQPYLAWSDYEATKSEGINRPFFTFMVVSCCSAMMFTSILLNDWKFEPLSVNPMIGPSAETLVRLGAKDSYLIVVQEEAWRLVSPMVLHAGIIHFILNMLALWFVGRAVENMHGFFPTVVFFVVPAVGGTILSAIFLPQYITVGASGGIFGLIGACISDIMMNWNLLFNEFVNGRGARLSNARVLIVLFLDIVLNCIIGLAPFIDNFTHMGGMVYGFLCGLSTIQEVSLKFFGAQRHCFQKCRLLLLRSVGLIVCMVGIIASSIVLFSGDGETNPCDVCVSMSCLPFPPWADKHEKWWYCDDCSRASANGTLDTATGMFVELNINCPSGMMESVNVTDSGPHDEAGLEAILPMLCREHCLWS